MEVHMDYAKTWDRTNKKFGPYDCDGYVYADVVDLSNLPWEYAKKVEELLPEYTGYLTVYEFFTVLIDYAGGYEIFDPLLGEDSEVMLEQVYGGVIDWDDALDF
jgi:hypothetical protein